MTTRKKDSMNWLACNSCCRTFLSYNFFYISTCSHIFCSKCLRINPSIQPLPITLDFCCSLCKKNVSMHKICEDMDKAISNFFRDPIEIAKEHLMEIKAVAQFQASHCTEFLKHFQTLANNESKLREHCMKLMKENDALEKQITTLQNLNKFNSQEMENFSFDNLRNFGISTPNRPLFQPPSDTFEGYLDAELAKARNNSILNDTTEISVNAAKAPNNSSQYNLEKKNLLEHTPSGTSLLDLYASGHNGSNSLPKTRGDSLKSLFGCKSERMRVTKKQFSTTFGNFKNHSNTGAKTMPIIKNSRLANL